MDHLKQTAEQVAALIPRVSWQIMDEDQRDALIAKVVLPRYGAVTRDGVKLGPTWWAQAIGADEKNVRDRIFRLRRSEQAKPVAHRGPSDNDKKHIRSTKSALRQHPELARELIKDPQVRQAIQQARMEDLRDRTGGVPVSQRERRYSPLFDGVGLSAGIGKARKAIFAVAREIRELGKIPAGERDLLLSELDELIAMATDLHHAIASGGKTFDQALADLLEGGA